MPYQSAIAHANISYLQARQQELGQKFCRKIVNNPDNQLFGLLSPLREATIIGLLILLLTLCGLTSQKTHRGSLGLGGPSSSL